MAGGPRSTTGGARCGRGERGSASLELAVVFPAVLLLIFIGVQTGLWYYARSVALAAAQEGSRAAGAERGTATLGAQAAAGFVQQAGGADVLQSAQVSAARTATRATVTVTGQSLTLVPGIPLPRISQTASVPVERITQ